MGLFDHLFKPKTDSTQEEPVEAQPAPDAVSSGEVSGNIPAPKPPLVAPPPAFAPRSLGHVVTPGRAGSPQQRAAPAVKAGGVEEKTAPREITLTLDDVLARIPKELLAEGACDGRRPLRFAIDDLSADIARGRAAVPLSQIAAQCPDVFRQPIGEDDDLLIRLPLQKLVEQIALGGITSTLSRGTGGEAPADAKIHLSIAAILRTCPREIIIGELPPVGDTERIVFPFAPIERQLPSGRVDVSSIRFVAALPLRMHEYFRAIEGVRVPLPLDEIFQNLPGLPTAAPVPVSAPEPPPAPAGEAAVPPAPIFAPAPAPIPGPAPSPGPSLPAPEAMMAHVPVPRPELQPQPEPGPKARLGEHVTAKPEVPRVFESHVGVAKDEIAELRARIAALKIEFDVSSVPPAEEPPIAVASPVPEPLPVEAEPSVQFVAPPVPKTSAPPVLGLERSPSVVLPVSVSESAPEPPPASMPAPMPELFRPPLVLPPIEPVVVPAVPKIEPPPPVMLPVRMVAPPPARPHVAPPPLFSGGANVDVPEIHVPEAVAPPEPPAPPPPPPPLALERVREALGFAEMPTLAEVAGYLAVLPGLSACVLDVRHEAADTGAFTEGLDAAAVRSLMAPLAAALAGRTGEHITIFGEHGSISVLAKGEARLAVLHRARVFLPGVRERLVAAVEALAEA